MEKVNLTIHVIPDQVPIADLDGVTERETGTNLSTTDTVRVSRVENGYAILYTDNVIGKMDPLITINYIVKLLVSKLPGKQIHISLEYHFDLSDGMDLFDDDVGEVLQEMDDILIESANNVSAIVYERSQSMEDVIDILEEDEDDDGGDDYEASSLQEFDPSDIGSLINMINQEGSRSKKSKRGKKKYKNYAESEVLHETKNAKRCYNRHGVMVCSDKDALKHDQKMIKEFLKDFIPGEAEWKKDFRRDLQKRWMQMYVISKKQLKHLQKQHSKAKSKKRRGINTEKALDFTRRMFNVPATSNAWNDPSR